MKRAIVVSLLVIVMLLLLPSCTSGVSKEEYSKVSSNLAAAQTQIQGLQSDLGTTKEKLSTTTQELSATKEKLSTATQELSATKDSLQNSQTQLGDMSQQLKDKTAELYSTNKQLADAQKKIQSYQNVFPLREFTSLSELQGWLNFNAKGWQLDILKMQEDKQFSSVDFARKLQAAGNEVGYSISIQIDKATGHAFNTVFIGNTVYAIEPQYTVAPGGMATNKVWVYAQIK